ncbi:hypothetical protein ACFU7Y_20660 [Kitasatospora sp. NPDC057542]|nr:hypothetical protein [Streptomyces sp. LS1784]
MIDHHLKRRAEAPVAMIGTGGRPKMIQGEKSGDVSGAVTGSA